MMVGCWLSSVSFRLSDSSHACRGYHDLGSFNAETPGATAMIKAPFMDSLMAGGIKLRNFYVQPICS